MSFKRNTAQSAWTPQSKKRIEKVFHLSNEKLSQFEQMVNSIPLSSIKMAEKVISYAKETLNTELNDNIYIALTDHLNYAIERKRQGIEFQNALLWEIRKFYPKEFQIGQKTVEIVREDSGVQLSQDEAGFFALHIANAELQEESSRGMEMPEIIRDILNLVKFSIERDFKEDDLPWAAGLKQEYPLAYKTAIRIKSYIKAKLHYEISEEEISYLTIHIQRMINREDQ